MSTFTTRNGAKVVCEDPTCICNRKPPREQDLARIDQAADEYLLALEAWKSAAKSDEERLLDVARQAYAEFIATVGAPYEVTS